MPTRLEELLHKNRSDFLIAIKEAEKELEDLEARRRHLLQVIERGRAAIGADSVEVASSSPEPLTLHAAMATILSNRPEGMRPADLTREVNDRGLYRKRDGTPVDAAQVHARVGHYGQLFEKRDGRIVLKEEQR
jgi:hypothetical protein